MKDQIDPRCFLRHGTYSNISIKPEPAAWRKFFNEIQERCAEMRAIAASVARVEADPTLDDTENEGIATRWGDQLTASLLLVKTIKRTDQGIQIMPLYGKEFTIYPGDRRVDIARAIHENLVRLPHRAVTAACAQRPDGFAGYVQGCCAVAIVDKNEAIFAEPNDRTQLFWSIDEGITICSRSNPIKTTNMDFEDESCE